MVVRAGEAEPGPLDQPKVACRLDPDIGDGDPTHVARGRLEEMRGLPRREGDGEVIAGHGREDAAVVGGDTARRVDRHADSGPGDQPREGGRRAVIPRTREAGSRTRVGWGRRVEG